ncbi:MAG: hypothetical protein Tsb0020_05050 [Haliangiales bacterium]
MSDESFSPEDDGDDGDLTDEEPREDELELALRAHDQAVARLGLDIWVGGEPTFTDRFSAAPAWNNAAEGEDKLSRGMRMAVSLAQVRRGGVVLRTIGRQYPGEERARWSVGVYGRYDGGSVWDGPPDPMCLALDPAELPTGLEGQPSVMKSFRDLLAEELAGVAFDCPDMPLDELPHRLVARASAVPEPMPDGALTDVIDQELLTRPRCDRVAVPPDGPRDQIAAGGYWLLAVGGDDGVPRVDLPMVSDPDLYIALLERVSAAARRCELSALIVGGFAPPVDERMYWATVTPDPGVIEVNMAPHEHVLGYYHDIQRIYRGAEEVGLAPVRYFFNGDQSGSGGGGHITLGGPTPAKSPFFVYPQTLPRLVAYAQNHPALSYWFSGDAVGSACQAPRADEGPLESFDELALALALIQRHPDADGALLWSSLAPFLTDRFGNSHRAEINVEKLWNPYLPGRGCLGLIELRAFAMAATPARSAALVALFRAVVAMLATRGAERAVYTLRPWGAALHDRFALPFFLRADLEDVLSDLDDAKVGLGDVLTAELLDDSGRELADIELPGATLRVRRGFAFWPLIGDPSQQEQTSRIVDPSGGRIEFCVRARPDVGADGTAGPAIDGWQLVIGDCATSLAAAEDRRGPARVLGIRWRRFAPNPGLHPSLAVRDPLVLTLWHPEIGYAVSLSLHGWAPDGGAYDGLPSDATEAKARRRARVVVAHIDPPAAVRAMPAAACTPYCVDTRWLD